MTEPAAESQSVISRFECAGFAGAMMQSMTWVGPKGTIVAMGYGLHPEEVTTAIP